MTMIGLVLLGLPLVIDEHNKESIALGHLCHSCLEFLLFQLCRDSLFIATSAMRTITFATSSACRPLQ